VLRDSAIGATGGLWRRAGVAVAIACAIGGVATPEGLAQQRTTANPQELWRAYPLEQRPATTARPPARAQTAPRDSSGNQSSASGPPWIQLLGVVAGGAAGILVALAVYRRQTARGARADVTDTPARRAAAEVQRPQPPPEPPRPVATADSDTEPVRAATPRATPICQVRWSRRGGRFYAVTTDADGNERRIARSPQFEWRGPSPPEQSAEAEGALRQLAKELRDKGWRPLRAKGIDFDERQWYARRFRWPAEDADTDAGRGTTPPRQQASGRPARSPLEGAVGKGDGE
jgi:hypothetical protein